jgi:cell division protein ZapD
MITFEYPLNEKNRSYLRFEFLFKQIDSSISFAHTSDSIAFFKALFELLELIERSDIRHDLIKDLELLSDHMRGWLKHKQVDHSAIHSLIAEIEQLNNALFSMPKQLHFFKKNRFLTSLKQRFSIPSGCCNFDLPQFHFWNAGNVSKRQQDAQKWFQHFDNLEKALTLFLKIKRSQCICTEQIAHAGFYQGETEHSGFITIKVKKDQAVYPMISGHKDRFSLRFISVTEANDSASNIPFQQIIC